MPPKGNPRHRTPHHGTPQKGKEASEASERTDMNDSTHKNPADQYADEIRKELNDIIKDLRAATKNGPIQTIPVTIIFHGRRNAVLQSTPYTPKDQMRRAIPRIAKLENADMITMTCFGWTSPKELDENGDPTMPGSHPDREHVLLVSGISRRHPWSISFICPLKERGGKVISIGDPIEATSSASRWLDQAFTPSA